VSVYVPQHFAADDRSGVERLIRDHPFATLVTATASEPIVSHVPLLLARDDGSHGTLIGHFARANPHAKLARGGATIAIFHGPHAYVSPSFYADPAGAVPTWNYAVVHAHGKLEMLDDARDTLAIVERLIERFESGRAAPWRLGLEGERLDAMLRAIVGFRLRIERVEAKFKLSQNRDRGDRLRVIAALASEGDAEAAATSGWMRDHASPRDDER
jgi:transcriptional regulator